VSVALFLSPLSHENLLYNSRGFSPLKQAAIFDSARAYDFVFIQETLVSEAAHIAHLSAEWLMPSFWSPALGLRGGVAVLVSPSFPGKNRCLVQRLRGECNQPPCFLWLASSQPRVASV